MRRLRTIIGGVACALMLLSTMSATAAATATPAQAEIRQPAIAEPTGAHSRLAAQDGDPVEIHTVDSLRFEPAKIIASPGQEIRVINDGFLQHSFVIDELGIATEILDNGGDQTITVPADAAPGEYTFDCSVPGHQAAGMEGTLTIVEAAEPDPPAPVPAVTGEPLFAADGVEATVLAQAGIAPAGAGSTLQLEMLEIAPGSELASHEATSSELFYALAGVVTFQDNFGFSSVVEAGQVVTLNIGTEYTIANTDSEAGRLLRLRLAGGAVAPPGATPVAGEGDGATVLMQAPLDGVELEGAWMYLGRAQFAANADSGEQGHGGPLGIYVDSGMVNVVSPSGLVGAIEEGRAVSLPAETPLHASTGDTEAVVFFAGIVGTEGEPFTELTSGNPGTEPGTVLESGQTWQTANAEVMVEITPFPNVTRFDFTYTNTGDSVVEVPFDRSLISVTDDRGGQWRIPNSDCRLTTELAPDESFSCMIQFYPPTGTERGQLTVTISIGAFGEVENASWQAAIDW